MADEASRYYGLFQFPTKDIDDFETYWSIYQNDVEFQTAIDVFRDYHPDFYQRQVAKFMKTLKKDAHTIILSTPRLQAVNVERGLIKQRERKKNYIPSEESKEKKKNLQKVRRKEAKAEKIELEAENERLREMVRNFDTSGHSKKGFSRQKS